MRAYDAGQACWWAFRRESGQSELVTIWFAVVPRWRAWSFAVVPIMASLMWLTMLCFLTWMMRAYDAGQACGWAFRREFGQNELVTILFAVVPRWRAWSFAVVPIMARLMRLTKLCFFTGMMRAYDAGPACWWSFRREFGQSELVTFRVFWEGGWIHPLFAWRSAKNGKRGVDWAADAVVLLQRMAIEMNVRECHNHLCKNRVQAATKQWWVLLGCGALTTDVGRHDADIGLLSPTRCRSRLPCWHDVSAADAGSAQASCHDHWEEGAWALCEARYRYTSFPTQICGQSELIMFRVFLGGRMNLSAIPLTQCRKWRTWRRLGGHCCSF